MTKELHTWEGNIKLGHYSGDVWHTADDFNHPFIQNIIKEVLTKSELLEGFELHIVGGILEGWMTYDIDWAITGPYLPKKIKKIMEWIIEVGFNNGMYPDVTYAEKVFDLHDWQKTGYCDNRFLYRYSNYFSKAGKVWDFSNYNLTDEGLYKYWSTCPLQKNVQKDTEGHKYKKPVKIF